MSRLWIILCLLMPFPIQGAAVGVQVPVSHWTVSGSTIFDPHGMPIRLRGFNVLWWAPVTDRDASDIQQLGANCVRYMFGYNPKGAYEPAQIGEVELHIHYFTSRGIWVIPVLYLFEKSDPADSKKKLGPWSSPEMNREFLAMWTDLMVRLKNEPYLAAWEPINEPHGVAPGTISAWYRDLLPKLRTIDPARPIIVEGANYSHAEDLTNDFKMDDPNIIYAFHMYYPYNYTTDIQKPPLEYPGQWGKAYLEQMIEPAKRFRDKYHVPVWCGEWGAKTAAPGYDRWLWDLFDLLPKDPQNESFDINKQKNGVYRVIVNLFNSPSLHLQKQH
jgi:hypothetical protein